MRGNWRPAAVMAAGVLGLALVSVLHWRRDASRHEFADRPAPPTPQEEERKPETPEQIAAPPQQTGTAVVSGRVMGRYGTIVAVPVRVVVDGVETAESRSDFDGQYRLKVPAGVPLEIVAVPGPWTELEPMRRALLVEPGADLTLDFVFGANAGASGHVEGPGPREKVTLLAIRVDDYPPSPGGWAPLPDLRCAPKLVTEAEGTFTFQGLDPFATYRLAVDSYEWGLMRPVFLNAGDTGIGVPLERLLYFVVHAGDIEGDAPLPRFTVRLLDREGQEQGRFEGQDGRLVHRAVHPEHVPPEPPPLFDEEMTRRLRESEDGSKGLFELPLRLPDLTASPLPPWKFVIEADGYLPATAPTSGLLRVFLQRAREPNVILHVRYEGGTPCDDALEGRFEAAEQPVGVADARVTKDSPGVFRAVLPPGAWRLRLSRAGDPSGVRVHVPVEVPEQGAVSVESPPLPHATG